MEHRAPSSSITYKWTYDVFLSFYGDDTRLGFTSYLYHSLHQSGIHAFLDDEFIRIGENITPALLEAIQESRIAIIVFSENYANSTFCLQELEKILGCFKEESRLIYPVFYYVDPSELRRPRGSYAKALARLEKRFKDNRLQVEKWRLALSQAAELKGCHLKPKIANEQECITRITNEIVAKINQQRLHITDYQVGIVPRAKEVISCLDLWSTEEKKMIGIWGAGGIGKSTIARAIYNSIADHFEGLCFLPNVRKHSQNPTDLSHLQETLLRTLVKEKDLKLGDYHEGIPIIEHRLSKKKILLILDDVDKSEQLKALAGSCNWFGCGSRIIITTRNKKLLVSHGVTSIYDVKELDDKESLKLLSWHAFEKENVDSNYMEVCNHAINYSCGFPLVLEVIGSNLRGEGVNLWRSALDQFKSIPHESILGAFKLSYDTLGEVEKQVFLDLACFFNYEKLALVNDMLLCVRGIRLEYAIKVLTDKSLIKIERDCVIMHDLIEDIGKEIVRQESSYEPGGCSRLWFYKDILHVLQQDTGTHQIEAIVLDPPESIEVQWSGEAFMKMKNLKMLVIRKACFSECPKYLPKSLKWLEWKGYSFKFLPSLCPTELVYLDLSFSYCELLQPFDKGFHNISCMNLRNCKFLQQIPDLSGASNLRELWLDGCAKLIEIHDSVGCLNKLRELSAMRCKKLKILPSCLKLTSLKHLNLFGCSSLQRFPEVLVVMEEMQTLDLDKTAITELPSSICNLIGLEILHMEECPNLMQLPASICTLPNLWKLTANSCEGMSNFKMSEGGGEASVGCSAMALKMEQFFFSNCNLSDDSLAFCIANFTNVIHLDLSFNNFTILPECIKEYHNLKYLLLDNCDKLEHIGGMPPNLEKFSAIRCTSLTKLSKNKVMKQAINFQSGKRNFILPGEKFPEGLHNYSRENFVSFWVRNMFPTIFLWILVKDSQDYIYSCQFSVDIDEDTRLGISSMWSSLSPMKTNHIYICDMQSMIQRTELPITNEWSQVKVSIRSKAQETEGEKEIYFGVHVYDLQSNLENIQFVEPVDYSTKEICIKHEFESYQDLEILEDGGYRGTTYPIWSGDRSYDNLIKLRLTDCNRCRRIPSLGQLPSLRSLRIERLESVVTVGSEFFKAANDCASLIIPFPSLETLHFEDMISWQQWHSIDMQAFSRLRFLRFDDCPKLIGNLPRQLLSLVGLEIISCPLLASSIPDCPNIHKLSIIKSQNVVLQEQELPPSLRRLAISGGRLLKPLSEKLHIKDLTVDCSDAVPPPVIHIPPSVKQLDIRNCENLKAVLVSKAPLLHLRKISICKCKFLPSLFDDMERLVPNLKELSIEACPKMEPFLARSLPSSLKRLEIRGCDKLLSCHTQWHRLPTITELLISTLSDTLHCRGLQHLNSLQLLEIVDSFSLEKLKGGMLPPSLHWLHIRDCGLLEERCRNKDEEIWPKISHVPYISLNEKDLRDMHKHSNSVNSSEDEGSWKEICIMHELGSYRDLEILEDGGYRGITYPIWSGDRSYDNLIKLRLTDCNRCRRIPVLGQLPSLRSLRIERLESVVTVGSEFFKAANDCASLIVPFPSLETLHFEDMISWQQWHSIDMQAFPKLRNLCFVGCPKLIGNLPRQLLSLESLGIISCPLLASSIPQCPNIHDLGIIKSPNVVLQEQELPPSLGLLAISGGRMLGSLSVELHIEDLAVCDLSDAVPPPVAHIPPSVKQLLMGDCENVTACLVSKAPLLHLRKISIYNCKFLTSLFDDMERLLPNLEKLKIEGCPEMEPFSPGLLPSGLKQLKIIECDKLLSCHAKWHHLPPINKLVISTSSDTLNCTGLQHLTSLQQLELRYSDELEKIEGGMMPPSLLMLHVRDCSLLEKRCLVKDEEIWPKISHVPYISLDGRRLSSCIYTRDMNDATILKDHQDNDATILEGHRDSDATIQVQQSPSPPKPGATIKIFMGCFSFLFFFLCSTFNVFSTFFYICRTFTAILFFSWVLRSWH